MTSKETIEHKYYLKLIAKTIILFNINSDNIDYIYIIYIGGKELKIINLKNLSRLKVTLIELNMYFWFNQISVLYIVLLHNLAFNK